MTVHLDVADGVGTVTLSDPGGYNALDVTRSEMLATAVRQADANSAVKVILLRAEGKAFCAGGAIDFFEQAGDNLHDEILRVGAALNPTIRLLHESPKITVVAAHGAVAGGGIGLMAAGDIVYLGRGTVLTLGFELLATNPDAGVSWLLPRDIGYRRAIAMYLTSERIDAERALELGMATYIVDDADLEEEAMRFAVQTATRPAVPHSVAKRLFRQAAETRLERQLDDEARSFADNTRLPDFAAGVETFLKRRKAPSGSAG